jgi:hypothetical protein
LSFFSFIVFFSVAVAVAKAFFIFSVEVVDVGAED